MALSTSHLPSMISPVQQATQPTHIQPNYPFTAQNIPRVQCFYHEDQQVQYFCKETLCLMPLCQICLQVHQQEHQNQQTRSNIVPLEASLTETYNNMARQANQMAEDFNKLIDLSQSHSELCNNLFLSQLILKKELGPGGQNLLTNPLSLIESARKQIHDIVDNYFNSLITFIMSKAPELTHRQIDSSSALNVLKDRWAEIIRELEILNSSQTLQQIIHFYSGDVTTENDKVLQVAAAQIQLCEQINSRPIYMDLPQLKVDPNYLPDFLHILERYASFNQINTVPIPERRSYVVPQQMAPIIIREGPNYMPYPQGPPPMFIDRYQDMERPYRGGHPNEYDNYPPRDFDRFPNLDKERPYRGGHPNEYDNYPPRDFDDEDYYPPDPYYRDRESPYWDRSGRKIDRHPYERNEPQPYEGRRRRSNGRPDMRGPERGSKDFLNVIEEEEEFIKNERNGSNFNNDGSDGRGALAPIQNTDALRRIKRKKSSTRKKPTNIVIHHVQAQPNLLEPGAQPYATIQHNSNFPQSNTLLQQSAIGQQPGQPGGASRLQNRAYL